MAEQASAGKKIVKAVVVLAFFGLFWKFGGFLLGVLMGNLYPPGMPAADAYTQVYKYIIFTFIYSSALKVLLPAFLPIFIERMKQEGEAKAWQFAYSIFNVTLLVAVIGSAIGIVAAPRIIEVLVPGFDLQTKALAVDLLRIMLPGTVGMLLSMVMMSILNSYKVFGYPAAGDAAQKLVWAVALSAGAKVLKLDARIIAYGLLAGCVVQFAVVAAGLRKKREFYRPLISEPGPKRLAAELTIAAAFLLAFLAVCGVVERVINEVAELLRLLRAFFAVCGIVERVSWPALAEKQIEQARSAIVMTSALVLACVYSGLLWVRARRKTTHIARFAALAAPLLIGVAFARYRDATTAFFQSYTLEGVFADIEWGKNVANLPLVLVAYGLSIAMFPHLCEYASSKDLKAFGDLVTRALRIIAIFFIPLTVIIILLDREIIALIYDRGNWPSHHLAYAGTAMSLFVFGLFFYAIENVLMNSFFSVQRMWMPTALGIVASLLQVAFLHLAIRVLGFDRQGEIFIAVSVAYPLTRMFKNIALLLVLRLHVPMLPLRQTLSFAGRMAAVCIVFGLVVEGSSCCSNRLLPVEAHRRMDVIIDTFNAENTEWTSRYADELAVKQWPATASPALCVRYRPMKRRDIIVEREFGKFRLDDVTQLSFSCGSDSAQKPQEFRVLLETAGGTWTSEPQHAWIDERRVTLRVELKGRLRRAAIVIPKSPDSSTRKFYFGGFSFVSGGREIIADYFGGERPSPAWADSQTLAVADVGGRKPESALLLHESRRLSASRDLSGWDLRRSRGISFKTTSEAEGQLHVELLDSQGGRAAKSFSVKPSATRETQRAEFASFAGSIDPARLLGARFTFEPAPGDAGRFWLDNITFTAARRIMGVIDPGYEIVKAVQVAVPAFLGAIAFVTMILALRIEEARLVFDWVLRQGRARLRKSPGSAPAA